MTPQFIVHKKNGPVVSPVEHDDAGLASPNAFCLVQFWRQTAVTPVKVSAPG